MPLAQPTPELHARRIEYVIKTIDSHLHRRLLDPTRCACGVRVAEGLSALQRHAVEQLLISLPETPIVEMPNDAELLDQALTEITPHDLPDDPSEEHLAHVLARKADVTRMHEKVYLPLITALVDELRAVGLGWETLAEHYADTLEEHRQERDSLRSERDHLRVEVRERNRAYGRASATIGELRGQLAWMRDRKFDEQNKRGAAVAGLVATRGQVERQSTTIRALINKVRELDATFDDTTLDGLVAHAAELQEALAAEERR
jgi:hypothetical protein